MVLEVVARHHACAQPYGIRYGADFGPDDIVGHKDARALADAEYVSMTVTKPVSG
jgi:hypothetical protein